MATPHLRELTEAAVFVPEVAKQHDEFACAIDFGACSEYARLQVFPALRRVRGTI